jgi:hypothetical protein
MRTSPLILPITEVFINSPDRLLFTAENTFRRKGIIVLLRSQQWPPSIEGKKTHMKKAMQNPLVLKITWKGFVPTVYLLGGKATLKVLNMIT